jgi:hypothetical protein
MGVAEVSGCRQLTTYFFIAYSILVAALEIEEIMGLLNHLWIFANS